MRVQSAKHRASETSISRANQARCECKAQNARERSKQDARVKCEAPGSKVSEMRARIAKPEGAKWPSSPAGLAGRPTKRACRLVIYIFFWEWHFQTLHCLLFTLYKIMDSLRQRTIFYEEWHFILALVIYTNEILVMPVIGRDDHFISDEFVTVDDLPRNST